MKSHKKIVCICSDSEWTATKKILNPLNTENSALGEYFKHEGILFFQTGWTKTAAAAGIQHVIDTYKPEHLINIGTCGGFSEHTKFGDILLIEKTVIYDLAEKMGDPDEVIQNFSTKISYSHIQPSILNLVTLATIASADADVDQKDITKLHKKYGALAADWESGSVAYISKLNKQKLTILRGVSDIVSETEAEAYGNEELFKQRSLEVMSKLIQIVKII